LSAALSPKLVWAGTPYDKVAARRRGATRDTNLSRFRYLPGARPSLDLLNAIGAHPGSRASTAGVAAAGGDGIWPLNADIRLVEVQGFPPLDTGKPQALYVALVEEGVAVVHVFKGEITGGDPGALVDLTSRAVGDRFDLIQGQNATPGPAPVRCVAEDVDGLLLHVLGSLGGGKEVGYGNLNRQVAIEEVCWLGYPPRG